MDGEMPIKPPIADPGSVGTLTAIGSWLITQFGPTETILIVIAGLMLGVTMGWMPSPMMTTMQAIREDQIKRDAQQEIWQQREAAATAMHAQQTALLRTICIHDSSNDAQKEECFK